jgi:hypothetical protein
MAKRKTTVTVEVEAVMEQKQAPPVSKAPVFTKRNILTFQRYAKRRDLLSVLLEDGKEYTMEQVDSLLQNFFKKGKVN